MVGRWPWPSSWSHHPAAHAADSSVRPAPPTAARSALSRLRDLSLPARRGVGRCRRGSGGGHRHHQRIRLSHRPPAPSFAVPPLATVAALVPVAALATVAVVPVAALATVAVVPVATLVPVRGPVA